MFTIREIIDDHFTIRAKTKDLPINDLKEYNVPALINKIKDESPLIQDFLKHQTGIHLMGSYSLLNENEDILVMFPPVEDAIDLINELKDVATYTTDPIILEDISFLVYCINIAANRAGDNMNDDYEESDEIDTYENEEITLDNIIDDVISLTTDQNDNLDTEFLHDVLNDKAPCTNLSFETNSGNDMYWFYQKILEFKIPASKVYVYIKNGAYCIIIPCEDLKTKQCIDIILKANESKITMRESLANISLMEHGTRLTDELIKFAGENNISLKGRRV